MRNVSFLHTTKRAYYVTNEEKKRTYLYKIYDFTKGGIDITDQRMGFLTCNLISLI